MRTFPPRSKIPMTAVLSLPPVPVMRAARFYVHVAGLAADESFVGFDSPATLPPSFIKDRLHGVPNAVKHEPCSFLSDAERPRDLAGANAVLCSS